MSEHTGKPLNSGLSGSEILPSWKLTSFTAADRRHETAGDFTEDFLLLAQQTARTARRHSASPRSQRGDTEGPRGLPHMQWVSMTAKKR